MKSVIKKASLIFVIMVAILMMSMTYAAQLFTLNNVPKSVTVHLNQYSTLPTEEPVGEYGGWEIISGETRANMGFGYMFAPLKTGTVKVRLETKAGEEHIVSIKIVAHKYDKTTDLCSCGARRPVSSIKFKETSFAFDQKDATIETGHVVKVPLFISQGERIVISTKDGKYVSRA